MLTPEQFMQLSMNYDPQPILASLQSGGGVTTTDSGSTPWAGMINPAQPGAMKGPAPLDPKAMMALNSLMPQPAKPQFIGGAAPQKPGQVNMQAPDIASLIKMSMASRPASTAAAPTLANLIGGR